MKNDTTIPPSEEILFASISDDLVEKGYSVQNGAFPSALGEILLKQLHDQSVIAFKKAGIGRLQNHNVMNVIRKDEISWIDDTSQAGKEWLIWAGALQIYLNRSLFLGLFSLESHFARYGAGDFYKKHSDAFVGDANRKLSLVLYLNKGWKSKDEGELILFAGKDEIKIAPQMGTIVIFLSEDFPHEVLETKCERLSITGWYYVNTDKVF